MALKVTVESEPRDVAKGLFECEITANGLVLRQRNRGDIVIPFGTPSEQVDKNRIRIGLADCRLEITITRSGSYVERLTRDLAAFVAGRGGPPVLSRYTVPWYFYLISVLPLGIPIVTLGGVIWAALGVGLSGACFSIVRKEHWPKPVRLLASLGIVSAGYTGVVALWIVVLAQRQPNQAPVPARPALPVRQNARQAVSPPSRRPTLQEAVAGNRVEEVKKYVDEGAEINTVYADGQTLLIRAVTRGHLEVVKLLLEHGADVNGNPDRHLSPLLMAIAQKRFDMAEVIMEYDPDLSVTDFRGHGPLLCALERDRIELAENLLARGADPNTVGKGWETALLMAVEKGQLPLVRLLLEKGANPNLPAELNPANANKRPLAAAICRGDAETIRLLASHGATATFSGPAASVLAKAVQEADPECRQALVDVSAEAILPDGREQLFYCAILVRDADLVQSLIKTGVDLNAPLSDNKAPLALAIRARSAEMIRLLVSHGAKVSFSDEEQELLKAVRDRNPEFVKTLIDVSADAILPNGTLHLLYAAVCAGNTDLVKSLIDAGANVEALLADKKSAEAVLRAGPDMVEALLEDMDTVPEALFVTAVATRSTMMIRLLASHGATAHFPGKENELSNAVADAMRFGDASCLKALVDVSADAIRPHGPQHLLPLAIVAKKADLVQSLIDLGVDPGFESASDGHPLNVAVLTGDNSILEILLGRVKTIPPDSIKAAVRGPSPAILKLLIDHGADLTSGDPLCAAAANTDARFAELLVDGGADLNSGHPLRIAAASRNRNVIRLLIDRGADVNAGDPLTAALEKGDQASVELLLAGGAEVRADHLSLATTKRGSELFKALFDKSKLDFSAEAASSIVSSALENKQMTAALLVLQRVPNVGPGDSRSLQNAVEMGNPEIVRLMLEKGADISALNEARFPAVVDATSDKRIELIRLLIDSGADPTIPAERGQTALHAAARRPTPDALVLLSSHFKDLNVQDDYGQTPLYGAVALGRDAVVEYLLEHNADPGIADVNGTTPLHRAAANMNPELVKMLVKAGADVNVRNNPGETPLFFAVSDRHGIPTIKVLLELGADPNIKPERSPSPLEIARMRGIDMSIFKSSGSAGDAIDDN